MGSKTEEVTVVNHHRAPISAAGVVWPARATVVKQHVAADRVGELRAHPKLTVNVTTPKPEPAKKTTASKKASTDAG